MFVKSKNYIVMSTTFRFVFKKNPGANGILLLSLILTSTFSWLLLIIVSTDSKPWLSVKPSLSASHLFFETMCYHWNALLVILKGGLVLLWDIFNGCFLPSLGKLNEKNKWIVYWQNPWT